MNNTETFESPKPAPVRSGALLGDCPVCSTTSMITVNALKALETVLLQIGAPKDTLDAMRDGDLGHVLWWVQQNYGNGDDVECPFCKRLVQTGNYTPEQVRIRAHEHENRICSGSSMILPRAKSPNAKLCRPADSERGRSSAA